MDVVAAAIWVPLSALYCGSMLSQATAIMQGFMNPNNVLAYKFWRAAVDLAAYTEAHLCVSECVLTGVCWFVSSDSNLSLRLHFPTVGPPQISTYMFVSEKKHVYVCKDGTSCTSAMQAVCISSSGVQLLPYLRDT